MTERMSPDPMIEDREPRTAAGKALQRRGTLVPHIVAIEEQAATEARAEAIQAQLDDISDIIAEKVAEARRELLAKVEELPLYSPHPDFRSERPELVNRAAVRRLIEDSSRG